MTLHIIFIYALCFRTITTTRNNNNYERTLQVLRTLQQLSLISPNPPPEEKC